ncbi:MULTISPECIES: hypothetical protein [unclassified Lentimicrobium]|uniref:hypothetical protein n=1 Tax=unclassified Lentimicrobium TaxID=2677434 RepID=UPI001551639F|nr:MULTISPECIES: hypothetical protein [unclassified Lentimicrobium]NPD44907.1 hypothetical protein [Lentimicrobium sp. S6]NPD83733.1 hypothetical protein [Lentimicrobium sp. L6]
MRKIYLFLLSVSIFSFSAIGQNEFDQANLTVDQLKMLEEQSPTGNVVPIYPENSSKSVTAITTFPFVETFEDVSTTRADWTQIQEVGTYSWTFAAGSSGGSITTAFEGVLNARYASGSFRGNKTKLVSPVMDLSGFTTVTMSFYYGQEIWAPDLNTTAVYYRISDADAWVEIANFTDEVTTWTEAILDLPNPSATYQVAFEGTNNFGRANVIDFVNVDGDSSTPPPPSAPLSNWVFMLIGVLAVTVVFIKFKK